MVFCGLQQLLWPVMSSIDRMPSSISQTLDEVLVVCMPPASSHAAWQAIGLHLLEMLAGARPAAVGCSRMRT